MIIRRHLLAHTVFALAAAAAVAGELPAGEAGQAKSAPGVLATVVRPRVAKAKIVDTAAMAAKPKPRDPDGWIYAWPEKGEAVRVRHAPAMEAPVFAEFAGGAVVEVYGESIRRGGVVWADVDFLGVRGWVPHDRLEPTEEEAFSDRRWDVRFISPSGKVVVEYVNHSDGYARVLKDGTGRAEYPLPLEPDGIFQVSGVLLFSGDESLLAMAHGGPSWGSEVFLFGRRGKGPFVALKANLQSRCWKMALEKGLIPAGATPAHLRMAAEKALERGFEVVFAGNYMLKGQTNFGPIRFVWSREGDRLELAK